MTSSESFCPPAHRPPHWEAVNARPERGNADAVVRGTAAGRGTLLGRESSGAILGQLSSVTFLEAQQASSALGRDSLSDRAGIGIGAGTTGTSTGTTPTEMRSEEEKGTVLMGKKRIGRVLEKKSSAAELGGVKTVILLV